MNNYPEYVEVNNRRYKINTDFRYAIECNRIAEDKTIGDFERALAVIQTLYGEQGLEHKSDYQGLLKLAQKYLACNKSLNDINASDINNQQPDMDYIEDYDYICASFQSDYNIDLDNTEMHWWKFFNLINGLSNSELGNCCVLNRIRNLRNFDTKDIKDKKELEKINKAKKAVELKKYKKQNNLTKEQEQSMEQLNKILGFY